MWDNAARDALANAARNPVTAADPVHLDWTAIGIALFAVVVIAWVLRAVIFGNTSGLGPDLDSHSR